MSPNEKFKMGIIGACGRGASFKHALWAMPDLVIESVCDTNENTLDEVAHHLGAKSHYTSEEQMLDEADLDGVIIGTPMHLHARQTLMALERDVSVLSEVTAAVSVEECGQIVAATRKSRGIYMMAENYTYMQPNVIVREMIRQGLFGTVYFADSEYIHETKERQETTPWRRKWQSGINGITYGTHSLGPILQWMPGDRVVSVCCAGSGHHHRDAKNVPFEAEDTTLMLCRMASGGLVKIRLDMLSNRPFAEMNYQVQGTEGCYESARRADENPRVWLKSRSKDEQDWLNLLDFKEEFLPDYWKKDLEIAEPIGHGGGDYFEVRDFMDAVRGLRPCPIGIHEAMDMTLPGLLSQQSIAEGSRWVDVPDSRDWISPRA